MVHEGRWQLVKSDDGAGRAPGTPFRMLAIPPTLDLFAAARSPGDQAA
jgi:hypothetical protein